MPAGSTGKFQPTDVILQRVFNHDVRRKFNALLANMVKEHLRSGSDSSSFKMNTHLGYLRDLTLGFLTKAYKYMLDNPDLVSQSWSKAAADVPNKEGQQINLLDDGKMMCSKLHLKSLQLEHCLRTSKRIKQMR